MKGLPLHEATEAIAELEAVLQRCSDVEVRRVYLEADDLFVEVTTNATRFLAVHGGDVLVVARGVASTGDSRKLTYTGNYFDNQIWTATMRVLVAVAADGKVATFSRVFPGQATFLSGQHVKDGTAHAIATAIRNFANESEFLRQAGLQSPSK